MTEDNRDKIGSCFESVEKMVSLRDALNRAVFDVSFNIEWAIDRLEASQFIDGSETDHAALKEGWMSLDNVDIQFINERYADSLWETMRIILPHYKKSK